MIVWYDIRILFQINVVSKSLQSTDMALSKCTEILKKCCAFLEEYKNTGYKSAILTAKELAEELDVEPMFRAIMLIPVNEKFEQLNIKKGSGKTRPSQTL